MTPKCAFWRFGAWIEQSHWDPQKAPPCAEMRHNDVLIVKVGPPVRARRDPKNKVKLAATLWWFTAAPKHLKILVFWGSPSPQGSYSPYILGDTTRPGVLIWSKSDRRRLRKTLHKQTSRQTNRQTDTTKIMVTWPWIKKVAEDTETCDKSRFRSD